MSGTVTILPLYAFMAWARKSVPFFFHGNDDENFGDYKVDWFGLTRVFTVSNNGRTLP